jgi:hypothetical protein
VPTRQPSLRVTVPWTVDAVQMRGTEVLKNRDPWPPDVGRLFLLRTPDARESKGRASMFDLSEEISQKNHPQLKPDVRVENHGTLYLVHPLSKRAASWLGEHAGINSQWFGHSLVAEHIHAQDLIKCMCEAGLLVRVEAFSLPPGDQHRSEMIRSIVAGVLGRHLIVKVRQRNVPYHEIAHYRKDTIGFRRRERVWNRWRGKLIEIDAATCKLSPFCGAPCWDLAGELKEEAVRTFGPRAWTVCAHQVEAELPC